jgi:protein-S-isoprenylcysteine O-methyltransferase Ste14
VIAMRLVYAFHLAFYALFLIRKASGAAPPASSPSPAAPTPAGDAPADPHARRLIALHALAFFVFYFGLGRTVFPRRAAPLLFASHPAAGGAIIVLGAAVLAWTLVVFRSWRLLARIDAGHELCTTGPFHLVRHPIYLSLDLLALGTAIWVPGPIVLLGAVLVVIAGDVRARAEERLLERVFGAAYREYRERVARTIPGLY